MQQQREEGASITENRGFQEVAMVVNLSHMLRQELLSLEKDPESSKLAMKALKSYVEEMDSKDLPRFLALVSETKGVGEHTISLFELAARTHGVGVVPQIGNIMGTILETLESTDAGSGVLHKGCAKLVQTIARYAIDPTACEDKKRKVIHFLCKPLVNCLMDSRERLAAGAAFCLKALVESDNWRFASAEVVNEVCVKAAGALEGKCTQPNSHMGLVMALAKRNAAVVDAYARLLVNAGLRILQDGVDEGDSEKGLSAIRMMNSLMKNVDSRSIFSELENVIEQIEKYQSDKLGQVNIAAYQCLLTAKRVVSGTGSELAWSYDGSNNVRRDSDEMYTTRSLDFDSFLESSFSKFERSCDNGSTRRSVNTRKVWQQQNGESVELLMRRNSEIRSARQTPLLSRSQIHVDNVRVRRAPRNPTRSLEDQAEMNSEIRQKQFRKVLSPCSKFELSPLTVYDRNGSRYANEDSQGKECSSAESIESQHGSEVLSTANNFLPHSHDVIPPSETGFQKKNDSIACHPGRSKLLLCFIMAMLTIVACLFLISSSGLGEENWLVPT